MYNTQEYSNTQEWHKNLNMSQLGGGIPLTPIDIFNHYLRLLVPTEWDYNEIYKLLPYNDAKRSQMNPLGVKMGYYLASKDSIIKKDFKIDSNEEEIYGLTKIDLVRYIEYFKQKNS